MDMTVSAPLDMGVGQQRYVVAYTLKQDTDKKPDILNAQKSSDARTKSSNSPLTVHPFADLDVAQVFKGSDLVQTSPAIRPDALFLNAMKYSSRKDFVSCIFERNHLRNEI